MCVECDELRELLRLTRQRAVDDDVQELSAQLDARINELMAYEQVITPHGEGKYTITFQPGKQETKA